HPCSLISSSIPASGFLIQDDRADGFAALHQVEAFVDALQWQGMRNQVINIELAFHIPVDNFWYVGTTACTTESRAFPFASGHQLERTGTDFLTGCSNADDEGLTPALVAAFQRLAHGGGV